MREGKIAAILDSSEGIAAQCMMDVNGMYVLPGALMIMCTLTIRDLLGGMIFHMPAEPQLVAA